MTNPFRMLADGVMFRMSVDSPPPKLKHLPTVLAFSVSVVTALAVPSIAVTNGAAIMVAVVAMALGTVLAHHFSGPAYLREERTTRWALIVPGISFLAIGLFREGTGGPSSLFTSLIVLPVVWIAAEEGRRWIAVAGFGSASALVLPWLLDWRLPADTSEALRGVVAPLVFALAAAIINELSRQGRHRLDAIRGLAEELKQSLAETIQGAEQLRENAEQLLENEDRLRDADELTRSVLDAVTEQSVIGTGLTGLIDVWNPGAAVMLGLAAHETQGIHYISDFHVEAELEQRSRELNYPPGETVLNPGFSALVEASRLGHADVRDWTYVRHDGSHVTVEVAITPRVDRDGETIGYIFVGKDVTQALEVSRLKDEFVGLISHELRTPLSSILGYLELMRDDGDSPLSTDQLVYLGVAERNAHRLLRLVGDLLFTAQVESGRFPLNLSDVPLGVVVSGAVESARPAAAAANVDLTIDVPDHSPVVRADAIRLGQAYDNLIANAIKFTPRGGSVTVSLVASADDAIISVRDTGIGIPEDELDHLYTRFFRASTATVNAVQGVGLGLTITKAIVTAHGGVLDVESEESVGTTFTMSLPLGGRIPMAV